MRIIHLLTFSLLLLPLVAFAQDEEDDVSWGEGESKPKLDTSAPEEEKAEVGKAELELGDPNIDPAISVTVKMIDGKSHSGKLTHVFKGEDWYGNNPEKSTRFEVKADVNLTNVEWKDVKSITVGRPNTSSDMDCYSDEDKDPVLWECTLKQPAVVKMKTKQEFSGTYNFNSKETITFVFDSDESTAVTMRLYKLVANTQHYSSMSEAIARLQGELKDQNKHGVASITFE